MVNYLFIMPSQMCFLSRKDVTSITWTFLPFMQRLFMSFYDLFSVAMKSQASHGNCVPLCTDCLCLLRYPLWVTWKSQASHKYFFPSCTHCLSVFRYPLWVAMMSHALHEYFSSSCTYCLCVMFLLWATRKSRASHGHFFPSCTDCLCVLR